VDAGGVRLVRGGVISATTFGTGDGGGIAVNADSVTMRGSKESEFTGLFARTQLPAATGAGGRGGDIAVRAGDVSLSGPAAVSASSAGSGDAGTVRVAGDTVRVSRGATLSTAASRARGGDVVVNAGSLLETERGKLTAESGSDGGNIFLAARGISLRRTEVRTAAGGDGGNITIDPASGSSAPPRAAPHRPLALGGPARALAPQGVPPGGAAPPPSQTAAAFSDSTINANGGINGGDVTIRPDALFRNHTVITATGTAGVSGTVAVSPAETELAGSLVALPAALAPENARLSPACGARLGGDVSTFVLTGRGGAPPEPGGWRADDFILGAPASSTGDDKMFGTGTGR
jgi:hypothetical protein